VDVPDIALKKYDKVVLGMMFAGILLALGGAGYGLYIIMPFLVELAKDTVVFFGLLFVAVFMMILAGQAFLSRDAFYLKMKMIARSIRRKVVQSDPIGAIDVAISRFDARIEEAEDRQREANAATARLEKQIRHPDRKSGVLDQAENEERLAQMLEKAGKAKADVDLHFVASERWRKAAGTLEPMLAKQKARQLKIEEAHQMALRGLSNLETQKHVYAIQLDALKAEAAQAKSYRAFFGRSADLDVIDMAVEEIERQSSEAEAEIVQLLRQADPVVEQERLQREVDADAARARLAAAASPKALAEPLSSNITADNDNVKTKTGGRQ
jgi:hypothetical protein